MALSAIMHIFCFLLSFFFVKPDGSDGGNQVMQACHCSVCEEAEQAQRAMRRTVSYRWKDENGGIDIVKFREAHLGLRNHNRTSRDLESRYVG
jgi:hypothetical protein